MCDVWSVGIENGSPISGVSPASMQAARHTPSPQHSGLNPNTHSNTSRRELLPSSHFSFSDDFLLSPVFRVHKPPLRFRQKQQMLTCLQTHTQRHKWRQRTLSVSVCACLDSVGPGVAAMFRLPSGKSRGLQGN